MPDEDQTKLSHQTIELDVEDFKSLSPEVVREIQTKYGGSVFVRSTSEGVDALLKNVGRVVDLGKLIDVTAVADFTRGHDRTSPGYSRDYSKDFRRPNSDLINVNPVQADLTSIHNQMQDIAEELKNFRKREK